MGFQFCLSEFKLTSLVVESSIIYLEFHKVYQSTFPPAWKKHPAFGKNKK